MKRKRVSRIVGLLALALLLSTGQTVWGGEARLPADAPTSQPPLDLVQITHNSGEWEQIDPIRISGYGNRVAFFVHPLGGGARDLYVANADGSGSTQLVATNVMMTYLDISDDGKRILFVPWDDGSHGLKAMHAYLFLVDQHSYLDVTACITHPDGIHQRCLPPNPSVGYPGGALSGDGRQVFYTSDMPWDCEPLPDLPYWNCAIPYGPLRLWGVQVEDGQARCRTDPNSDLGDIGSVDASAQGGVSSIYAFDGTTKNVFLTFRNSYQTIDPLIYYPVLSRNGYFTAGTSQDRTELWQVPFRNGWYSLGDPRCIFTSDNVLLPLGFSRDGQRILFTEHCGSSECPYLINLDGGDRVPAVPEDWIGCHQPVLLWSSSLAYDVGETVAFVSDCDILGNGNTHLQIFVLGDPGHSTGWKEIPHYSNPPARSGHKMVKLPDGRVLLFGGQDGSAGLSDELFAFQEDSWTPITPANDPPPPRRDHAAVSVGDAVYIHGGLGEGGSTFDDLWRYNADDNSWEMIITIDPPPARSSHSAWSWNDAVYIAGGQDSGTNTLQDLWAYDLIANTWQRRADAPVGFHHAGMASDGRYVYVLGVEDMPVYDTQTDTWSLLPQGPLPEPRRSPAVAQNAYKAWMMGGRSTLDDRLLGDTWEFNFATRRWEQGLPMPTPLESSAASGLMTNLCSSTTAAVSRTSSAIGSQQATEPSQFGMLLQGGLLATGVPTGTTSIYCPDLTAQALISPTLGATLVLTDDQGQTASVEAAPNTVSETTGLAFVPRSAPFPPLPFIQSPPSPAASQGLDFAGRAFALRAYSYPEWVIQTGFAFSQPVTITLHYTDEQIGGVDETTLTLGYWDGSQWLDAATTCDPASAYERHADGNWLAVSICRTGEFTLRGERTVWTVYLPLALRSY